MSAWFNRQNYKKSCAQKSCYSTSPCLAPAVTLSLTQVSCLSFCYSFRLGFLNLSTVDIGGWVVFVVETVLCVVGSHQHS